MTTVPQQCGDHRLHAAHAWQTDFDRPRHCGGVTMYLCCEHCAGHPRVAHDDPCPDCQTDVAR